ncbi:MAG: DnaJ domain-containing protein [Ruminococcus flavefaciens]|nr:DnaJ domain-containing protein [Ruminococcus flavefaciens]
MEWFKPGLDRDQLKKEYRKLCKQYHPDVSDDPQASEKMQEINYQFDEYFTHQARYEFAWASEARARQEARKTRVAILVRMYWDDGFGHYTTRLEYEKHYGYRSFWGWSSLPYAEWIVGHAVDAPGEYSWENFTGGLAYVAYEKDKWDKPDEVNLTRLPATITPASPEEVYWFNKDHWLDSTTDAFIQADCKFGEGVIIRITDTGGWNPEKMRGDLMMKATLPDEFLLGHPDPKTNAKYEARSIQPVNVRIKSIGKLRNEIHLTGADFPYMVYQNCTLNEFLKYHDVDYVPQYRELLPMREVQPGWLYQCPDPIIDYFHRKRILRFWCSNRNFKMMYGTFVRRELEQNMELMSVEDAEIIQDYLDTINENFDVEIKKMLKSGRIHLKI